MEKVFNKLVRDKVPEIIEEEGNYTLIRKLSDEEFENALNNKLLEEASEVISATKKEDIKEELSDLLEVMLAKAKLYDISMSEIEECRINKKEIKGTFEDRIFLIKKVNKKYVDENRGCLICVNESCRFPIEEKYDYDKDGKPAGYYCAGYIPYYKKKHSK